MGILNVDNIQPVGGGTTITLNSSEINVGTGITFESNGQAIYAGVTTFASNINLGGDITVGSGVTIQANGLINTLHAGVNQQVLHVRADLGSNNGRVLNIFTPDTDNTTAPFRFQTGNGYLFQCDSEDVFTIAHDRRIGIGTNAPSQKLEVQDRSGGTLCGLSVGTQYGNAHFGGYNNYPAIMNSGNQPLIYCDTNNDRTIFFGDTVGFGTTCAFRVNGAERLRLTSAGDLLFKKTSSNDQVTGVQFDNHGLVRFTKDNIVAYFIRTGSDGQMIRFYGDSTSEGSININGSSISYNGGVLSRWSQIVGISTNNKADRPTIYQGTVMSNLDEMCEWGDEENMQLNKTQVSNVSGDKNVAGVFWAWDDDDDTYLNDYYIAQTGDYIIRVGAATTVTRGDLLESAGDGTAKPQSDDIVRSKTVAKVTSGIAHTTYPDGTKTYPCVLMAS